LGEDERFLRDYFLSKQYDTDDPSRIPDYQELVGDIEEKEAEEDRMDHFEQKYNFRYEEPDQEFVSSLCFIRFCFSNYPSPIPDQAVPPYGGGVDPAEG